MSSTSSSNAIMDSSRALSRHIMRRVGMNRGNGASYFSGTSSTDASKKYSKALPVVEQLGHGQANSYTYWQTQKAILPQFNLTLKHSRQPR